MNIQTKKSERRYESKPEASLVGRLESFYRICGFSLLACCLLMCIAGAETSSEQPEPANTQASYSAKGLKGVEGAVEENADGRLSRKLWRARIGMPQEQENRAGENELSQLIEKVRSVEFKQEKETSESAVGQAATTEPNRTLSVPEAPKAVAGEESGFKLPFEPVSGETLHMLENLLQDPNASVNTFELGDILFLSGNMEEAAMSYQEALNRKEGDDVRSVADRAWVLFQIGNCLRRADPPVASQMYRQLIARYPESPWTDLAKAQDRMIDWYEKDKPWTLVGDGILQDSRADGAKKASQ